MTEDEAKELIKEIADRMDKAFWAELTKREEKRLDKLLAWKLFTGHP